MNTYDLSLLNNNLIIQDHSSYSSSNECFSVDLDSYTDAHPSLTPLANFFSTLNKTNSLVTDTGIMPPGVLHVDSNIVVFERPPQFQNIQMIPQTIDNINYDSEDPIRMYRLPIPWQLYICTYNVYNGRYYPSSIKMFFANQSLTSPNSEEHRVYLPTLPNFYTCALLCNPMFSSMEDIERYDNNVSGVIQASYDWVWNSGTNLDLTMNIAQAYYHLKPLAMQGVPTVFKNASLSDVMNISSESFYVHYMAVHFFFTLWEKLELHEVSSLVWPNASVSSRIFSDVELAGTNYLSEYFKDNNIPLSTNVSDPNVPLCENVFCVDQFCQFQHTDLTDYDYDHADYIFYLRNKFASIRTFKDAYECVLSSMPKDSRSYVLKNLVHRVIFNEMQS